MAEKVSMRLRPIALGVLVCAGLGTSAAAQAVPSVGAARQFHVRTGVNVSYDTNFSRTSKALAALRGVSQNEVTTRPEVSVELVQPLGRQVVYLNGNLGYEFHRENDNLDRGRGDVQAGYATQLGFCQVSANGNYRASQADLATVDTLRVKNLLQTTGLGASAQCGRPQGIVGSVSVQHSEARNSATLQKLADNESNTISVAGGYGNQTLGRLMLTYGYTENDLPNRINPGRPPGDGFKVQSYGVSYERALGSRINMSGMVGRSRVKREFAPVGTDLTFSSTTYSGAIDYTMSSRLNFNLSASRAVVPSIRAGKLYDIATTGQAQARYNLGSRFVLTLGHRIADTKSNTDTTLNVPVLTKSRANSTYGSVTYRQSERASLTLDARYDDRNTNTPDFNYTATTVGLTLEVGF